MRGRPVQVSRMMWLRQRAITAIAALVVVLTTPGLAAAAPHASVVMDMRSGEILFARNHDTRLHPASLTKMMTLYIAFEAVRNGEISLDTPVRISANAAGQPCSCLGLRAGQTIALRYLIRAAALRSGNDAATAIGEAISGSEAAFIARMNRTAAAMGMTATTFRNAHGLTAPGHLSSARDMTTLGRQLFFDFPEYYNLFSRRSADAGVATVPNTNRAFLNSYAGADGIKTGFTRAAGFNLTASAERGSRRIIVTLFGGASVPDRTRRVTELMDMGFARAPATAPLRPPAAPSYGDRPPAAVAMAAASTPRRLETAVRRSPLPLARPVTAVPEPRLAELEAGIAAAVVSAGAALATTAALPEATRNGAQTAAILPPDMRPPDRPDNGPESLPFALAASGAPDGPVAAAQAVSDALAGVVPEPRPEAIATAVPVATQTADAAAAEERPSQRPFRVARLDPDADLTDGPFRLWTGDDPGSAPRGNDAAAAAEIAVEGRAPSPADAVAAVSPDLGDAAPVARPTPAPPSAPPVVANAPSEPSAPQANPLVVLTYSAPQDAPPPGLARLVDTGRAAPALAAAAAPLAAAEEIVLSQMSTSDARLWGITIGRFGTRDAAERALMRAALAELSSFDSALRRVQRSPSGFDATFVGLSESEARMACHRLIAHDRDCAPIAP
ncbi:MAG: serine hydrolase [Alkalilacustris sp.]